MRRVRMQRADRPTCCEELRVSDLSCSHLDTLSSPSAYAQHQAPKVKVLGFHVIEVGRTLVHAYVGGAPSISRVGSTPPANCCHSCASLPQPLKKTTVSMFSNTATYGSSYGRPCSYPHPSVEEGSRALQVVTMQGCVLCTVN